MIYPNNLSRDSFYNGSEAVVEKADHIRLQYITFNYQFNDSQLKYLGIKQLEIFANVNNLGVLWTANRHKIDPEYSGFDSLLPSKTFSVGLRANLK